MKYITRTTLFASKLFVLSSFMLMSCMKHEDVTTTSPSTTNNAAAVITTGTWTITSHVQRTENKTSNYAGISFTFSDDGKITATGSTSATGTWSSSPGLLTLNLGNNDP